MSAQPILVTGFNAFGGELRNPAEAVIRQLQNRNGFLAEVLRTEFEYSATRIAELLTIHRPPYCICLGLNQMESAITLERQAVNRDDARIPDNSGDQRQNRPIDPRGAALYSATLPMSEMAAALVQNQIPVRFSDSAGTFVCNHVFYTAGATIARLGLPTRFGFIHLPWPDDWPASKPVAPGLPLADIIRAVNLCLEVCEPV